MPSPPAPLPEGEGGRTVLRRAQDARAATKARDTRKGGHWIVPIDLTLSKSKCQGTEKPEKGVLGYALSPGQGAQPCAPTRHAGNDPSTGSGRAGTGSPPAPLPEGEGRNGTFFYFRSIWARFEPFCIWGGLFSGALRAVFVLSFLYLCR